MKLKGKKFDNVDMIQADSKATLRNLSKSDFISFFDNWKKRWNRLGSWLCVQENLLLDDKQNLKLIDFGLCAKPKGGMRTQLETCCGSPAYAAPELVTGAPYLGPEVDIWSMGVLLYALLCGFLPFDDENVRNLYRKIKSGKYSCPPWLSSSSRLLLSQMLQVDPKSRITVAMLLNHPWLTKDYNMPVYWRSIYKTRDLNEECLMEMARYHQVSREEMALRIKEWNYDEITAAYFLLDQCRRRGFTPLLPRQLSGQGITPRQEEGGLSRSMESGLDNKKLLELASPPRHNKENLQQTTPCSRRSKTPPPTPVSTLCSSNPENRFVANASVSLGLESCQFSKITHHNSASSGCSKVKPFCPCFDFVSHRNGGSTNLHQVLCEKRIQGCRNFLDVANSLRGCPHEPKRVFEWYKRFKEGREETADNERSGRPSTSTTPEKVDKVLELVREDRRITVREVAEEAGISFESTQSIMKDILGARRLNAVLVPKDLTFDQRNARKETASLNLEATTDDPELLKRVITGDETWIYGFDSETTQQASEWRFKNEPRPKKARKAPSKVKVMLTVFFDYQGIVHNEFQQQGSTITADSYLGVLRRLREAIRQKRSELWRIKSWILHHDNAPAHTALKISKFLQDQSTSVFPQPPYSPDLAPCDFFLFGKLKKKVIGSEISEHRRDQSGIEEGHEGDPENRLPEVFCRLEKRWL
ncbi:hypothetical protein LAZ67_7000729 [Cordylochernes scorpioides]|uniref:Protein kinase domain-containing protein n=1 Tax=Cordylochernes scorpioides TaxID=51811 RepID=A0ABY6KN69_9ARAC|nr:hypothetical protein LAZ67_7000729 [Cordylochernes scorpioides]